MKFSPLRSSLQNLSLECPMQAMLQNTQAYGELYPFRPNFLVFNFQINLMESIITLGPTVWGTIWAALRKPSSLLPCATFGFVCE